MDKVYNFSAGPGMLPDEVKKDAQRDFLSYNNTGMSVMEMSHRSKPYEEIHFEVISLFRYLMNIGDEYHVLLIQGGATQQFDAVPLNLFVKGKADYIVTGNFASKAAKEALKYGDVKIVASSKDKNFTYIPDVDKIEFSKDADYTHITTNNTIFGVRFRKLPSPPSPLVADVSSNILGEVMDINKFGLIYAGAQKNIGPSGLTVVIVRKDLINNPMSICPTMLKYSEASEADSLHNTPSTYSIYMAMLTLRWLKKLGGVAEMQKFNDYKAGLLYDFIDNSSFYKNPVEVPYRSIMNVPFVSPNAELDALFCKEATASGLISLKGHRLVGGMRASIYNAMPLEGVKKLIEFMKKFESENK
ncbi:MAG: 3-phosphoserine/phosphohydroxythreonine transaminase [Firmicutes bacterium]|nr:3-phosphoserine/phosphohydroxythreonine transaminase [Bacillota bacterium]